MKEILDTVLLLALPASGKSEVRRYLAHLSPKQCQEQFHLGPTTQLDDYPYVHAMRRIDQELARLGHAGIFFESPERPFRDPRDWGTLVHLVNEDYRDLKARRARAPASAAARLLSRIEAAARKAGLAARLARIPAKSRRALIRALEKEARQMQADKRRNIPKSLEGRTLVIEFARGGPEGSSMPLPAPLGYRYSLSQLDPAILRKAAILYVWVTPEESRRKNEARADPDDPGSILHHGVPPEVMRRDYGCDDMDWLEKNAARPGTVSVRSNGRVFYLPAARFDNRIDKTSFLRAEPRSWKPADIAAVHQGLKAAFDALASTPRPKN